MLWPARFTSLNVKLARAALALSLIAAAACSDRVATGPQRAATPRASTYINTAPPISVSPGDLYYANQALGTSSAPQVDTIRNTSTEPLTLYILSGSPYPITSNNCPATLAPNQFCTISVVFAPTSATLWVGMVMISSPGYALPYMVGLYGTGYVPGINVSPTSIGFGSVKLGTVSMVKTVTITSTGWNGPLIVSSLTLGGTNAGDFTIVADGCTGASLNSGASCTVKVIFEPLRIGARTATLSIASNVSGGPAVVSLSGTGTKPSGGIIP
jgi:hypothetical protein